MVPTPLFASQTDSALPSRVMGACHEAGFATSHPKSLSRGLRCTTSWFSEWLRVVRPHGSSATIQSGDYVVLLRGRGC